MIPKADKSLQQCFDKIAEKVGTITKPYRGKLGNVYTALFVHNPLITLMKIYKSSNYKTFKVIIHKSLNIKSQQETKKTPHRNRHFQKIYGGFRRSMGP